MARPIVGSMSDWSGLLKDLFRQIDDGSLAYYNLRAFLEHRDPFTTLPDIPWLETYKALGLEDCWDTKLLIPESPELWVLPMFKGVTSNNIVAGHKRLGVNYYLYANDLDTAVPTHDRNPSNGSYAVSFHRNAEADEEFKNLSANQPVKQNHKGITLPERLLLGAGFYVATGQHLDVENVTLCAGSRDSDGSVPAVDFNFGFRKVHVGWCYPGNSGDNLRSRSVVS